MELGKHLKDTQIEQYPNNRSHLVFDTSIDFVKSKINILKNYENISRLTTREKNQMYTEMYKYNCNKYFLIGMIEYTVGCSDSEEFPDYRNDKNVQKFVEDFDNPTGSTV